VDCLKPGVYVAVASSCSWGCGSLHGVLFLWFSAVEFDWYEDAVLSLIVMKMQF